MKKIRVVETRTVEYVPDLSDVGGYAEFYLDRDCKTIEDCMKADQQWIKDGKGNIEDLSAEDCTSTVEWSIVDED